MILQMSVTLQIHSARLSPSVVTAGRLSGREACGYKNVKEIRVDASTMSWQKKIQCREERKMIE